MATGQTSPKRGKVIDIPANAPTIGTAVDLALTGQVSVPFTAGSTATGGPVFYYTAVSNPGSITGTATSTPIIVSGLTDGTAYTFTVAGTNATGNGPSSAASNSATPTVTPTSFNSIATAAATGSSVTFSSIPGTYKHLQIRSLYRDTSTSTGNVAPLYIVFNADGGNNYAYRTVGGASSTTTPTASYVASTSWMRVSFAGICAYNTAGLYGASIVDILSYSSSAINKTIRYIAGGDINGSSTGNGVAMGSGLWMNTNAITSITVYAGNGGFASGSTLALYGIS